MVSNSSATKSPKGSGFNSKLEHENTTNRGPGFEAQPGPEVKQTGAYHTGSGFKSQPTFDSQSKDQTQTNKPTVPSKFKRKAARRFLARQLKRDTNHSENALIDEYITWTEDELTSIAKSDTTSPHFEAIKKGHGYCDKPTSLLQRGIRAYRNGVSATYGLTTRAKQAISTLVTKRPHVHFANKAQLCTYDKA